MDNVFIDTDVILDFFFERATFAEFATRVLNQCEEKKINGFTTIVVISNVYYMLRKAGKHTIVIEKLKQLLSILEISSMDKKVVLNALNSKFKDFEDALQNYAAVENGTIDLILTRNSKDYKKSELAVITPGIYLKSKIST